MRGCLAKARGGRASLHAGSESDYKVELDYSMVAIGMRKRVGGGRTKAQGLNTCSLKV